MIGVQGTVRAEPMTLQHGNDRFTPRFDCKPCEMHVVGKIRKHVLREAAASPLTFYRSRTGTAMSPCAASQRSPGSPSP